MTPRQSESDRSIYGVAVPLLLVCAATDELELTRAAVTLVMNDVEAELGQGAIVIVVGSPDELSAQLAIWRPTWRPRAAGDVPVVGWVLDSGGHSAIALTSQAALSWGEQADLGWTEVVVRVADTVQEGLIEGTGHVPFPICRTHGVHPMDAAVMAGVPSWICPKGAGEPVPIGALGIGHR